MLETNVYEDILKRSGGDAYVGVVGPVRAGKSSLINKFLTEFGAQGEKVELLPTAQGREVVTKKPVETPAVGTRLRFCDCTGFRCDGATVSDGEQVKTPWADEAVSFDDAAKLCIEKGVQSRASFGILVTCDGTIADLSRESYAPAEERSVSLMNAAGKPYVIVLNCASPESDKAKGLKSELEKKYQRPVVALNAEKCGKDELTAIFKEALFDFPVTELNVNIPEWLRYLGTDSSAIGELLDVVKCKSALVKRMRDFSCFDEAFSKTRFWNGQFGLSLNLADGKAELNVNAKDGIFFDMLSEISGDDIKDECSLMSYMKGAAEAKRGYDKLKDAFECARLNGYGIVQPCDEDLSLEEPKVIKQGASVGIKLRATAPCYHVIKVDVSGEVSPIMGSAAQNEEIVNGMMSGFETDPEQAWGANLFGKSLKSMVKEGLSAKIGNLHDDVKSKMRRAMTRIVNEGKGGIICILL